MTSVAHPEPPPRFHPYHQDSKARPFRNALLDIVAGWQRRELWATLGLHDVRQRYRRSTLGPFWITFSMGVMVFALGLLYSQILKQDLHDYLPFLAAGFVIWGLISALILDGCQIFIAAEGMIRQLNAPLSIYAFRSVWSVLIAFAHNIWIFMLVAWWYDLAPTWHMLWALPALLLLLINGCWMSLLFGLLSARFRDVPLIVGSVIQVFFFMTPVIWRPDLLPQRALILEYNPFYHMVEILRAPLLGLAPEWYTWRAVILLTLGGWAVTLYFFTNYRWRIAYWV